MEPNRNEKKEDEWKKEDRVGVFIRDFSDEYPGVEGSSFHYRKGEKSESENKNNIHSEGLIPIHSDEIKTAMCSEESDEELWRELISKLNLGSEVPESCECPDCEANGHTPKKDDNDPESDPREIINPDRKKFRKFKSRLATAGNKT